MLHPSYLNLNMRPTSIPTSDKPAQSEWNTIRTLIPYLMEFKGRVVLAMSMLVLAKLANVAVPLVLMHARLLWIGGWLNLALMATFLIVIASGVQAQSTLAAQNEQLLRELSPARQRHGDAKNGFWHRHQPRLHACRTHRKGFTRERHSWEPLYPAPWASQTLSLMLRTTPRRSRACALRDQCSARSVRSPLYL